MENNKSKRVKCLFCKQIEFITNDPKDAICVMCILTNNKAFNAYIKQSKTPKEKAYKIALFASKIRKIQAGNK